MKRLAVAGLAFLAMFIACGAALADNADIDDETGRQLEEYDFSSWQEALDYVNEDFWTQFSNGSVDDIITRYTSGGSGEEFGNVYDLIWGSVSAAVRSNSILLVSLLGIALLSGLVKAFSADHGGLSELTGLIFIGMAISLIVAQFSMTAARASIALDRLESFENAALPTLLVMLSAIGSINSGAAYGPVSGLLSGAVIGILRKVVLPLVMMSGVLGVINSLTDRARLKQLHTLAKSSAKWVIGIVSTVYFGVLAIQGIAASTFDSVSIRTAKYALSSFVPVLGGMVSGTVDTVLGCGVLIKNAAGITSILIAVGLIYEQLISILGLVVICRVSAALCDAVSDGRLPAALSSLADTAGLLFAIVLAVGAMFAITVGLIVATGNMVIFGG